MQDDLIISELQSVQQNNQEAIDLEKKLETLSFPFIEKGPQGEWFFLLDPEHKEKKYLLALAECMDDRNAHDPLILLLSVLRYFGVAIEELEERSLKALEIFAPKILHKVACAGPFTLRKIPKEYYKKVMVQYPDVTLILLLTAHIECGAHGKNNLQAILKRLQLIDEVYGWKVDHIVPVPLLSRTTTDHSLEILDSYDEVLDIVRQFADSNDDLEALKTAFIQLEHLLKIDLELHAKGRYLTELWSRILENGNSSAVARFLELDHGNIREHHTKYIYTNVERVGMTSSLLNPSLFIADYQYFQLDVMDFRNEEDFDELLHEVQVALHYTNGETADSDAPTFWHINIAWDNKNKNDFLEKLKEELQNPYNPYARDVWEEIEEGKLIVVWNEFDKNNVLQQSEKIEFHDDENQEQA